MEYIFYTYKYILLSIPILNITCYYPYYKEIFSKYNQINIKFCGNLNMEGSLKNVQHWEAQDGSIRGS